MARDDNTVPMFFDGIEDALREVVRQIGGNKVVGAKLWPEKPADEAGRRLADCFNDSRREVLSPPQVMFILKWGREVGAHAGINYIARECGYADPAPLEPEDERAKLQREFIEAQKSLIQLAGRIEAISAITSVSAVRRAA